MTGGGIQSRRLMDVSRLAVLALFLLTGVSCSQSVDFERMRQQPRGDAYGSSSAFENGMVMRVPPPGTAARPESRVEAVQVDARHVFDVYCAVCHGTDGSGQSIMTSNIPGEPMLTLRSRHTAEQGDEDLSAVIAHGRRRMPAFDWALPESERLSLVAYIRSLGRGAAR